MAHIFRHQFSPPDDHTLTIMKRIKYYINNIVEVIGNELGLIGSYYAATEVVVHVKFLHPMHLDVASTCYSLDECKFGFEYFVHFDITNKELPYPVEKLKLHLHWSDLRRK
ncbi:hypothetical protein M9H77_29921 [Catharanthus roseus]|uniref:Uncharacterized protein n=1 Tax=Catharanthus roseus TaxID=4058 RepID=A0ACB9ZW37_CATRO|nr:hypothetical protein M9H77_29921 [Catharanthus roseus]